MESKKMLSEKWDNLLTNRLSVPVRVKEIQEEKAYTQVMIDEYVISVPGRVEVETLMLLAHERGHIEYNSFDILNRLKEEGRSLSSFELNIFNIAEDIRVDVRMSQRFKVYDEGEEYIYRQMKDENKNSQVVKLLVGHFKFYKENVDDEMKEIYRLAEKLDYVDSEEFWDEYKKYLSKVDNYLVNKIKEEKKGGQEKSKKSGKKKQSNQQEKEDGQIEMEKEVRTEISEKIKKSVSVNEDWKGVQDSGIHSLANNKADVKPLQTFEFIEKLVDIRKKATYSEAGNKLDVRQYIFSRMNGNSYRVFRSPPVNSGGVGVFTMYLDVSGSMDEMAGNTKWKKIEVGYSVFFYIANRLKKMGINVNKFSFNDRVYEGWEYKAFGSTVLDKDTIENMMDRIKRGEVVIIMTDGEINMDTAPLVSLPLKPIMVRLGNEEKLKGFDTVCVMENEDVRKAVIELNEKISRRLK